MADPKRIGKIFDEIFGSGASQMPRNSEKFRTGDLKIPDFLDVMKEIANRTNEWVEQAKTLNEHSQLQLIQDYFTSMAETSKHNAMMTATLHAEYHDKIEES